MRISFRAWLAALFFIALIISCIRPPHLFDFVIEHLLTAALVIIVVLLDRQRPLTKTSLTLVFIYAIFHILGAHYTYSEVPYDRWTDAIFGRSLSETFGWQRNHYDRLIHFLFGLLMVFPAREALGRYFPEIRDGRLLIIAVIVVALGSKFYELLEWAYTLVLAPTDAARYNGEQGDMHDAQKDMALAFAGSLLSGGFIYIRERRTFN